MFAFAWPTELRVPHAARADGPKNGMAHGVVAGHVWVSAETRITCDAVVRLGSTVDASKAHGSHSLPQEVGRCLVCAIRGFALPHR